MEVLLHMYIFYYYWGKENSSLLGSTVPSSRLATADAVVLTLDKR